MCLWAIHPRIFLSSCSPLALPPTQDTMDTRLSVYGGGATALKNSMFPDLEPGCGSCCYGCSILYARFAWRYIYWPMVFWGGWAGGRFKCLKYGPGWIWKLKTKWYSCQAISCELYYLIIVIKTLYILYFKFLVKNEYWKFSGNCNSAFFYVAFQNSGFLGETMCLFSLELT